MHTSSSVFAPAQFRQFHNSPQIDYGEFVETEHLKDSFAPTHRSESLELKALADLAKSREENTGWLDGKRFPDLAQKRNFKGAYLYSDALRELLVNSSKESKLSPNSFFKQARRIIDPDRNPVEFVNLVHDLQPSLAKRVGELTRYSLRGDRVDHQKLLFETILDHPAASDPLELAKLATSKLDSGLYQKWQNQKACSFYEAIFRTLEEPSPKVALALRSCRDDWGHRRFDNCFTDRVVYEAALDPKLDFQGFKEKALEGVPESDQAGLGQVFDSETARSEKQGPHKQREFITALTRFSLDDERHNHVSLLKAVPLAELESIQSPVQLALRAIEIEDESFRPNYQKTERNKTALYYLAARNVALHDERAQEFVSLGLHCQNSQALFRAALHPEMNNLEVYQSVTDELLPNDGARHTRRALGSRLFPELDKRASGLSEFTSQEYESEVWDQFFQAMLAQPREQDLSTLVESIAEECGGRLEPHIYEAALGKFSLKNGRAKVVSDLLDHLIGLETDWIGTENLGNELRMALCPPALNGQSSDRQLVLDISLYSPTDRRSEINRHLGQEFFPEMVDRVDRFSDFLPDFPEKTKAWGLFFEAHLMGPHQNELELGKRAISNLDDWSDRELKLNIMQSIFQSTQAGNPQAGYARDCIDLNKRSQFPWSAQSYQAILEACLENLSDGDLIVEVSKTSSEHESKAITAEMGHRFLSQLENVPHDILKSAKEGEYSAKELRDLLVVLSNTPPEKPSPEDEIEFQDDLIIIGDEVLDVDL